MKKLGFLLLLLASLTGCRGGEENATSLVPEKAPPPVIAAKPKPVAINPFAATYQGNLPCNQCQEGGVKTVLQLTDENRYFLTIKKAEDEQHFSGQYRISADKRFIQLDDSADTLTFLLGGDYLEARLPDGSTGKRQFSDKHYQLERQPLEITSSILIDTSNT